MEINYIQFLHMTPEVTLMLILVLTFVADFCSARKYERPWFNVFVVGMMVLHTVINIFPGDEYYLFGGMYHTSQSIEVIKTILSVGTVIVLIQASDWLSSYVSRKREGEFYMLIISTLLGMNMMVSANHFLLFYLGLEMASIPMACLVAFDKESKMSAEAGAKFILTAAFSSGVMLYGISFLYGAAGTLYFDDITLAASPLTIMGLVFFFSGLGFKISLVPFHFWTADTYQGAPTTVTAYLSVISKGAAAFTLCTILMKVFAGMYEYWAYLIFIVATLSITVANLFAIHQKNLKRFMAFSSISQAGYIVLAVVGNSEMSVTALSFYVLVYVVANLSVFAIIAAIEQQNKGNVDIDSYNGLYTTNPRLAFLMTLALFSLGGIPPFAGMFSKFFVFMAAVDGSTLDTTVGALAYATVFVALLNTVISLYYYLLIVKAMYIKHNDAPIAPFEATFSTKFVLALCTAGVAFFGVCSYVYQWIYSASVSELFNICDLL